MSYVDNLYTCFGTVQKFTGKSRRGVEDLIRFFRMRIEVEEENMKGLEKLANFNLMLREGTILNAVNALKNNCYSRAFQGKTLIDSINADIISPLTSLLKSQSEIIQQFSLDGQKIQKVKETYLHSILQSKKQYWKSCQECEKITIKLEDIIPQSSREKLLSKLVSEKQDLDTSLLAYQESLQTYQRFKSRLKDTMTPIMNMYELQETERLESIKDGLRKLVVYDTSHIRNVQYDIDTLAHYMESINTNSDLKVLIDESAGTDEYPNVEFEGYYSEHQGANNFNRTSVSIPIPLQEKWAEMPTFGTIEEMYRNELDVIAVKVFSSRELTSEDFQQFNTLIKDSIGRKAWIGILELKVGSMELPQQAFDLLGELMISLLNECERNMDTTILKEVLRYSLHFQNENSEKLSKITRIHSIWSKLEAWEQLISRTIQEEISSREVYKIFESVEEQEGIIKNIAFCQLGSIAGLMKEFSVEVQYAAEILSKYACRYNLIAEDIDTLMATVDPMFKQPEKEVVSVVQRGVPGWLKSITAAPQRRGQKGLTGLLNFPYK